MLSETLAGINPQGPTLDYTMRATNRFANGRIVRLICAFLDERRIDYRIHPMPEPTKPRYFPYQTGLDTRFRGRVELL
jgi:hypothetical protein